MNDTLFISVNYNDLILSRRIVTKSIKRHFTLWKNRYFFLDFDNTNLCLHSIHRNNSNYNTNSTINNSIVNISLANPSIQIIYHSYEAKDCNMLSIQYVDLQYFYEHAIIMKFESFEQLTKWKSVFTNSYHIITLLLYYQ